ncbi:MAG: adenylosuccinate lyase, partial [Candidatus Methanomethylophilaceae archaeon]|nr:adenylosuccinate lyase [Candidatus Methanomethylophilaceae archaeon]
PHVFALADEMLKKTDYIFGGLTVHSDVMLRNIESSKGLVMAEPVMMKLTEKGMGRQDAHEVIRKASMTAVDLDRQLRDVLLQTEELKGVLTAEEIRAVMDPASYTGGSGEITDRMVAAAEKALGRRA